jgi:hypothetical protein
MNPEPTPVPLALRERRLPWDVTDVSMVTTAGDEAAAIADAVDVVLTAVETPASVVEAVDAGDTAAVVVTGRGRSVTTAPDATAAESMEAARTRPMSRRRRRGIGGTTGSGAWGTSIGAASDGSCSVDGGGNIGSLM